MALIKCPECGRENVSDTAISCPDCGFNVRKYVEEKKNEQLAREAEEKALMEKQRNIERQYQMACDIQQNAKTASDYSRACNIYRELGDYKDSKERLEASVSEHEKLSSVQKKKVKKIAIIVAAVVGVVAAVFLIINLLTYFKGISLYNNNAYDEALAQFEKVKVFDTTSYVRKIYMEKNYQEGIDSEVKGNYSKAIESFSLCGDYKDARERIEKDTPLLDIQEAEGKMAQGDLLGAKDILEGLPDSVKANTPEVNEYLELIQSSIDTGWGGIWLYRGTFTSDTTIFADLIIKNKELYVKFTDVYEGFESNAGTGKVSGNTVEIPGKDYTAKLLSSTRMQFYGKIEFEKVKDYYEMDDYR